MKRSVLLVLVGATLGFGALWLSARDARQREAGRAEVLAAQLDSAAAHHVTVQLGRARQDSAQRAEIARLEVAHKIAAREFARTSRYADSLATTLETHLAGDTTAAAGLMRETVTAYQAEVAACSLTVSTCEAMQVRQDSVIHRQDSSLTDLRGLYDATERALRVERRRANPGLLRRLEMSLPWMGATALIVMVVAR